MPVIQGQVYGTESLKPISMATESRCILIEEFSHFAVDSGFAFVVTDVQSVDTTTIKYQLDVGNGDEDIHTIFNIDSTGEILVVITEGSDRDNGTALLEINRNRQGTPAVAGTVVTRTPTGGTTDGATQIYTTRAGATKSHKTVAPGTGRGGNEFVLKNNTKYVVSITTFATVHVSFQVDWYEHTPLS